MNNQKNSQNNKKSITISDVAKLAGVSMMTVSRVLNSHSYVKSSTKEKVLGAIEELGFKPNVSARNLSSSRSYSVGLIYNIPAEGGYVGKLVFSALHKCKEAGLHLLVEDYSQQQPNYIKQVEQLVETYNLDGLIILPPLSDDEALIELIKSKHIPSVRISATKELDVGDSVYIDDYAAAFEITEYLIAAGHREIGFIKGGSYQAASHERQQGFLAALEKHQLSCPEQWQVQGNFSFSEGLVAAEQILSLEQRPTAIFACNDEMAAAAIAMAHKMKISVPEELSVAGFDDTEIAKTSWPPVTTIQQPLQLMATTAIDLLVKQATQSKEPQQPKQNRLLLDHKLIQRDSVLVKG